MAEVQCGFAYGQSDEAAANELCQTGPTLHVRIGFDPNFQVAHAGLPQLPEQTFPALIDTGAFESCIDTRLARRLALPVIDRTILSGASGPAPFNLHLAQIIIPDLNCVLYGQFAGISLTDGEQPHYALIGRNLLEKFRMIYNGKTGSVLLQT